MLEGLLNGLFLAWILTWFDLDKMFIEAMQPFIEIKLTTGHFYILLAFIGIIGEVFRK